MNPEKMNAVVYTKYGAPEVLSFKEVDKPIPNENEILIRIHATAVNSADWRLRSANPWAVRLFFGLTKPKKNILGGVFSGEIEAIGKNIKHFKVNDNVFGSTGMSFGAYAEYKCLSENDVLAIKPSNITHAEAAVIPFGGTTALYFIKKASIKNGQKVLINGASGAVGSSAIQLAKYYGAHVTGICSTSNLEMVKSLGADNVLDYTKDDFAKCNEMFDVIIDTVDKLTVKSCLRKLNIHGKLILSSASLSKTLQGFCTSLTSNKKVFSGIIKETPGDILFLKELIESKKLKAVIDKTFRLEEITNAHTYVEKGHKKGNVSIIV
jgi:NADPH:quinone reductase-like Zn-dependent oxidoreductase